MDESISRAKARLSTFRLKELKDVLGKLGLSKQGRKQALFDRLDILITPKGNAGAMSPPGHSQQLPGSRVAEAINEVFRLMHTSGAGHQVESTDSEEEVQQQLHLSFSSEPQEGGDSWYPQQQHQSYQEHHNHNSQLGRALPGRSPLSSPPHPASSGGAGEGGTQRQSLIFRLSNPNARKAQPSSGNPGHTQGHLQGQQAGSGQSGRSRKGQTSWLQKGKGSSKDRRVNPQAARPSGELRCVCNRNNLDILDHEALVECNGCHILEHAGCVLLPPEKEKGKDGAPAAVPTRDELSKAFYCELCRLVRGDPYSIPVSNPMFPRLLKKDFQNSEPARQSLDLTFTISSGDAELLQRPYHILQVYCLLINDRTQNRMHWPAHPDLQINGRNLRVTSRPGQQLLGANGRDEGPPVGDMVHPHFNRLTFRCQDARPFALGLRIIRFRSLDEVMALVPPLDVGETLEDALKRVERCVGAGQANGNGGDGGSEDSDDVVVMSDAVSYRLADPMSGMRVKEAGRFRECQHMGCFDLPTLVQMNKRAKKWQCPVCMKLYTIDSLIVDAFFQRVCQQMVGLDDEIKDVELKPGGLWRPKPPPSNKPQVFAWRDIRKPFASAPEPLDEADEANSAPARASPLRLCHAPSGVSVKPEPWAGAASPGPPSRNTPLSASTSLRLGLGNTSCAVLIEEDAVGSAQKRRRLRGGGEVNGLSYWVQGETGGEPWALGAPRALQTQDASRGGSQHQALSPALVGGSMVDGGGMWDGQGEDGGSASMQGGGSGPSLLGVGHEDAPIVLSDSDEGEAEEPQYRQSQFRASPQPQQQGQHNEGAAGGAAGGGGYPGGALRASVREPSLTLSEDTPLSRLHGGSTSRRASVSPLGVQEPPQGGTPLLPSHGVRPSPATGLQSSAASPAHQQPAAMGSPLRTWAQTGSRHGTGGAQGLGSHLARRSMAKQPRTQPDADVQTGSSYEFPAPYTQDTHYAAAAQQRQGQEQGKTYTGLDFDLLDESLVGVLGQQQQQQQQQQQTLREARPLDLMERGSGRPSEVMNGSDWLSSWGGNSTIAEGCAGDGVLWASQRPPEQDVGNALDLLLGVTAAANQPPAPGVDASAEGFGERGGLVGPAEDVLQLDAVDLELSAADLQQGPVPLGHGMAGAQDRSCSMPGTGDLAPGVAVTRDVTPGVPPGADVDELEGEGPSNVVSREGTLEDGEIDPSRPQWSQPYSSSTGQLVQKSAYSGATGLQEQQQLHQSSYQAEQQEQSQHPQHHSGFNLSWGNLSGTEPIYNEQHGANTSLGPGHGAMPLFPTRGQENERVSQHYISPHQHGTNFNQQYGYNGQDGQYGQVSWGNAQVATHAYGALDPQWQPPQGSTGPSIDGVGQNQIMDSRGWPGGSHSFSAEQDSWAQHQQTHLNQTEWMQQQHSYTSAQ